MKEITSYQQRALDQCGAWADGRSYHEKENGECCPDFSCCVPDLFEKDQQKRRDLSDEKRDSARSNSMMTKPLSPAQPKRRS